VYNGNSYSKDQINDLIQVIRDNPGQPEGVFTVQFYVEGDSDPRYARVTKTSNGVEKFEHQYKATCTNSRDTTNFPVTISFYKDEGINLSTQTTSNMAGWRCSGNNQLYGSFITGMQGDVTLNAEFVNFNATPTTTELTASNDYSDIVRTRATITITNGTGSYTLTPSNSYLDVEFTNPSTYTYTVKLASNSTFDGFIWFPDDTHSSVTILENDTGEQQIIDFTLKNKYKVNILNPNNTAAGVLSPNEFDAGSTLNMASLASVVSDPSPRQIVAYKDTSTGGNTYKTTDTVTLNSSNFTSRNITLQAKLNFTATISGGDTTISGQDGTYANPYHLKLGGTDTEQKINIDITDKVGDIRIRAGTTGYVGVTGSGTSFAAEISSGIDPNSVPATPILLKIIDVVQGTASTTAAESNPANVYATKEVYVQIDRPTLTVTFNANGGTNAPASVSVLYGNKISAPTTSPSKNGATFGGWYTSNDGGATLSATQFNFTSTSITSNLTLYAKWLTPTVALSATSGDITSLVFGESVVLTATPTNFPGTPTYTWNISPSGAGAITTNTISGSTATIKSMVGKSGDATVSVTATYTSGGNTLTATSTSLTITVENKVSATHLSEYFLQFDPNDVYSPLNITIANATDSNLSGIAEAIGASGKYVNLTLDPSAGLTNIFLGWTADSMAAKTTYLVSIVIPEGVTQLNYQAFQPSGSSSNLKSVTLPASLTKIDAQAFTSCTSLTSVTVNGTNSWKKIKTSDNSIIEDNVVLTSTNITNLSSGYNYIRNQ
ncbi:MAG: InlB B-repeat-containing protein, partial [Spirochaetaceae bacterium]|nr:InlB B-repeat-containing protein [Spirochaetaceae bacterium]